MRDVRDITGANVLLSGTVPVMAVAVLYGAHFVDAALVDFIPLNGCTGSANSL